MPSCGCVTDVTLYTGVFRQWNVGFINTDLRSRIQQHKASRSLTAHVPAPAGRPPAPVSASSGSEQRKMKDTGWICGTDDDGDDGGDGDGGGDGGGDGDGVHQ